MSKRYGQQLALDNVNLTIQKGEIYGLIGKNGAGKTTLIKVITKLIQPSQGSVSVFGSSTQSEWTHALKRVGSVIETPVALNHLTARQNLHYYCKARHVPNADKVIDESLTLVGLTNTGKKKFRGFSLGMKQRLGIAIALIVKPDFLILDEPINGLDPVAIKEFRHMIKKLNEEHDMTVIISSHILSELYQVATKFGIIENGRIIKEISKADFDTQSEDYIVLKTSHINMLHTIQADFYRLFRSKGFWISEFFLILNIISGVFFGDTGHVGIQPPQKVKTTWTGFKALVNCSNNISTTVLFILIIIAIVVGVDLNQKLYKNSITCGVSRTGYFFAKASVIIAISFSQFILSYALAFILGTIVHGLGTAPHNFAAHFAVTVLIQLLCSIAWASIATFALYMTHSIVAIFVSFILGTAVLGLPTVFFPN